MSATTASFTTTSLATLASSRTQLTTDAAGGDVTCSFDWVRGVTSHLVRRSVGLVDVSVSVRDFGSSAFTVACFCFVRLCVFSRFVFRCEGLFCFLERAVVMTSKSLSTSLASEETLALSLSLSPSSELDSLSTIQLKVPFQPASDSINII